MARRGRKGKKRRYYGKKKKAKGGRKQRPVRIGATVGAAKTIYDVEVKDGMFNLQKANLLQPSTAGIKETMRQTWANTKVRSGPAVVGFIFSYGEKLPVVGRPYQKLVKRHLDSAARLILGKGFRA